jgi:DNA-binding transcriptional ArsR family regulator
MSNSLEIAEIGALLGDPARAAICEALIDGRALTAKELAFRARVTPQTASAHLRRLTEANLLGMIRHGRNHYFRIASPSVAQMIEAIGAVAATHAPPRYRPTGPRDAAMREMRLCYDHLAGRLAVEMADAMTTLQLLRLETDGGEITPNGFRFFEALEIDLVGSSTNRRAFCRPCLDWSERKFHVGGSAGAALARHCFAQGWMELRRDSRAVSVTAEGERALLAPLGVCTAARAEAA